MVRVPGVGTTHKYFTDIVKRYLPPFKILCEWFNGIHLSLVYTIIIDRSNL